MKTFETPEINVLEFAVEDIITESNNGNQQPMADTPCTPMD